MGKRGPAKTPTAALKLHGSRLVDGRDGEPQPPEGWPARPDRLSDGGREVWGRLLPQLDDMGVLTQVDGPSLARYCEMTIRFWELNAWIRENGETYTGVNAQGTLFVRQYPQVAIAAQLAKDMLRIEQEFGLTPASRAGLKVEKPTVDDLESKYA